ncbi:hypothetical protein CLOM_g18002 [Closterium sp. NIES-68]|nr:hypothetical protein CLOM_g18002 [Closterium sp. NIES-68]GJP70129.1 hypothetical protein CLOP_g1109 [Closterium sp. NIES-67]
MYRIVGVSRSSRQNDGMLLRATKTVVCCTLGPIVWGLLSLLFLLLVALGVTALVLYFVYKPQLPECDVQSVTVTRLNVTRLTSYPFNETTYAALAAMDTASRAAALGVNNGSTALTDPASSLDALGNATVPPRLGLNADVGFTLESRNPNKVAIDYKYVNASIIYRGVTVGNTSIPPFTQQAQTNTSVPAQLIVIDFPLDIVTGPVMLADLNAGSVPLQLLLQLGARINILGVASPFALVGLLCDVTVDPITRTVKETHCSLQNVGFA